MVLSRLKYFVRAPETYLGLAVLACLLFLISGQVRVENFVFTRNGETKATSAPFIQKFQYGEFFDVAFDVEAPRSVAFDLNIIPDDCVESLFINGHDVDMENREGKCDYGRGFILTHDELARYGAGEKAHVEMNVVNYAAHGGLNLLVKYAGPRTSSTVAKVALTIALALLCLFVCRRLRLPTFVPFVVALGVALRVGFSFALPDYTELGHDTDGHLAYMQYVMEQKKVPGVDDCWCCYHPPLYYGVSSVVWKGMNALGLRAVDGIQTESVAFSILFLLISVLILNKILPRLAVLPAAILLAFWPEFTFVSARIGNDVLFYLFHVICLWGSLKYVQERSGKHLFVAVLASVLAILTKSTGAVSCGVLVLALLLGYFGNRPSLRPSRWELASIASFACLMAGFVVYKLVAGDSLVGNASGLHGGLRVGKDLGNFLAFDLRQFLTEPYTSPWNDEMGRQYFWNYTGKTALFGQFRILENEFGLAMASLVSVSFLGLVVYAIRGLWNVKWNKSLALMLAQGILFVFALMALRYKVPFACSNDFRYIVPSLLSFISFAVMGIRVPEASFKWKCLGYSIEFVFVASSVALVVATALSYSSAG